MQGHTEVIDMRHRGRRPVVVAFSVQAEPQWRHANSCGMEHHEIAVNPAESIDRLDLRCVFGLDVIVTGERGCGFERTIQALCAACVAAGAERVVGYEWRRGAPELIVPDRAEILFEHGVP